MTNDDWATLQRLRQVMEKGKPDEWFIAPDLSNGAVSKALAAVEAHCEQLMRLVEKTVELAAAMARETAATAATNDPRVQAFLQKMKDDLA